MDLDFSLDSDESHYVANEDDEEELSVVTTAKPEKSPGSTDETCESLPQPKVPLEEIDMPMAESVAELEDAAALVGKSLETPEACGVEDSTPEATPVDAAEAVVSLVDSPEKPVDTKVIVEPPLAARVAVEPVLDTNDADSVDVPLGPVSIVESGVETVLENRADVPSDAVRVERVTETVTEIETTAVPAEDGAEPQVGPEVLVEEAIALVEVDSVPDTAPLAAVDPVTETEDEMVLAVTEDRIPPTGPPVEAVGLVPETELPLKSEVVEDSSGPTEAPVEALDSVPEADAVVEETEFRLTPEVVEGSAAPNDALVEVVEPDPKEAVTDKAELPLESEVVENNSARMEAPVDTVESIPQAEETNPRRSMKSALLRTYM